MSEETRSIIEQAAKHGDLTSERQVTASSGFWGVAALVLGILTSLSPALFSGLDPHFTAIAGVVISVAGVVQKSLVDYGYIRSRERIKEAAIRSASFDFGDSK